MDKLVVESIAKDYTGYREIEQLFEDKKEFI